MKGVPSCLPLAFALLAGGCDLDQPVQPKPTPLPAANIQVTNIDLYWSTFSTGSWVSYAVQSSPGVGVNVTNYQVHYSFDGVTFPSNLSRLVNPVSLAMTSQNNYFSCCNDVAVGSQAVINAKGTADRVYTKIILQGLDQFGRSVEYSFTATWII